VLKRLAIPVIALAVVAAGCSSQPESCDEVADETIVLMQDLIDEVESELGDMSVQELIESFGAGEEIPSVEAFEEKAEQLSERAGELGCTQEELEVAVAERTDRLTATTPLGQFIIQAIEGGGL
jgi:hypothetical protein